MIKVERLISNNEIKKIKNFKYGKHITKDTRGCDYLKVAFVDNIKVIFKPNCNIKINNALFAYNLNKFLGYNFVPVIVKRKIKEKLGTLQVFHNSIGGYVYKCDSFCLFYFLSGLSDITRENILNTQNGLKVVDYDSLSWTNKLYLGDFPFMLEDYPENNEFLEVSSGDLNQFPIADMRVYELSDENNFIKDFSSYLSEQRLSEIIFRLRNGEYIGNKIYTVIYKNKLWIKRNETVYFNYARESIRFEFNKKHRNKNFKKFIKNNRNLIGKNTEAMFCDRLNQLGFNIL